MPVYRVAYQKNGGGHLLAGGVVRLLGIIQYVSLRNWPKPGKLVAFCIVDQSKKKLTPLYLIFFFFLPPPDSPNAEKNR